MSLMHLCVAETFAPTHADTIPIFFPLRLHAIDVAHAYGCARQPVCARLSMP
jgi:hypothetical protein